ncbi:hypothetical protein C8R30_11368 [Nitrosomonas nitrosa]|nr:hypothetical protein C8R30_11368 [Nitrosomonas nitrosa]
MKKVNWSEQAISLQKTWIAASATPPRNDAEGLAAVWIDHTLRHCERSEAIQ